MADSPQPPELEYPLLYVFRVIAKHSPGAREHVRSLVQSELGPLPDEAITARESKEGKFIAVHVSALLTSEDQRRAVYVRLKASSEVVLSL
jgi:putative lipoic acid-binding regulatory protein